MPRIKSETIATRQNANSAFFVIKVMVRVF
nr:MAG TPA: hypothetical protein [Caudoviricetes sp.]